MEDYSPSSFNLPGSLSLTLSQPEGGACQGSGRPSLRPALFPKTPFSSALHPLHRLHMAWIQSWSLAKILLILDHVHFIFCYHLKFTIQGLPSKPYFLTFLTNLSDLYPFFKPLHLTSTWMEKLNEMISHLKKKKWIFPAASNTKKTLIKSVLMDFQCPHQAEITTDLLTTRDRIALCHQVTSHRPLLILDFLKWAFVEEITLFIEPQDLRAGKKLRSALITICNADGFPVSLKGLSFRTLYLTNLYWTHHSKRTPYCSPPQLTFISPVFLSPESPSCHPSHEP